VRTISTADLAAQLRLAIVRTARRLRQEAGTDLSPSLAAALSTVERHGPMTPSEVASRERIQRPTVTRVLARLEEQGLIERMPDVRDGRSSLVTASRAGRELLAELRTRKTAFLAHRIEGLDAEERATLARAADILERMLDR
jgi:DNA-binding MarR family transcriptional regulator